MNRLINNSGRSLLIAIIITLLVLALLCALYLLFAHSVISDAYHARSIAILNGLIRGQADHPLEDYLKAADKIFLDSCIIYLGIVLTCFLVANSYLLAAITLLSIAGMFLVILGTSRCGPGITTDSVQFVSVARSLLAGTGYMSYEGAKLITWPPLYPTILYILGLLGIEPLKGARLLNVAAFGSIIFTSGTLFRYYIRSKWLIVIGVSSVLLSLPLLKISMIVLTDPLFILLALLFFAGLKRFLDNGRLQDFALMCAFAILCCLQRYVGIFVIPLGFLLIVLYMPAERLLRRIEYGIIFTAVSVMPLAVWLMRNYILTSAITVFRPPSTIISAKIYIYMINILDNFTACLMPETISLSARIYIIFTAVVIGLSLEAYLRFIKGSVPDKAPHKPAPVIAFILIYIFVTAALSLMRNFANIDYRLLAPVYVFLMILIFMEIERALNTLCHYTKFRAAIGPVIVGLCALWLVYPFSSVVNEVSLSARYGVGGFNTVKWQRSPLIAWLKTNPLHGRIYSNSPHAAYILSGIIGQMCPNRNYMSLYKFKKSLDQNQDNYLIWFKRITHNYSFSDPVKIGSVAEVTEIKSFSDGNIYIVKPKH